MTDLVDDLDYERDVLKFKELWKDIKNPPKGNLRTIEEKPERNIKRDSKSAKQKKESKKTTVFSGTHIQRNPKENPHEVIQIVTKPQSSFQDSLRN